MFNTVMLNVRGKWLKPPQYVLQEDWCQVYMFARRSMKSIPFDENLIFLYLVYYESCTTSFRL